MTEPKKKKGGRPKKGTGEIPEWFDINKYRDAENFSASDWYEQLSIRRCLIRFISGEVPKKIGGMTEKSIKEVIKVILDNPLDNLDRFTNYKSDNLNAHKYPIFTLGGVYALRGSYIDVFEEPMRVNMILGVDVPTNDEIRFLADCIKQKTIQIANQEINKQNKKVQNIFNDVIDKYDCEKVTEMLDNRIPLLIDVNMPDDVLVDEFKDFLIRLRLTMPHRKNIAITRATEFNDWYEKGVLPYLDIQILEKLKMASITGAAFIKAWCNVFDKSRDDAADPDIFKSTKKYAQQLIKTDFLRNLLSQAQREKKNFRKKTLKFSPARI